MKTYFKVINSHQIKKEIQLRKTIRFWTWQARECCLEPDKILSLKILTMHMQAPATCAGGKPLFSFPSKSTAILQFCHVSPASPPGLSFQYQSKGAYFLRIIILLWEFQLQMHFLPSNQSNNSVHIPTFPAWAEVKTGGVFWIENCTGRRISIALSIRFRQYIDFCHVPAEYHEPILLDKIVSFLKGK